MQVFKLFMKVLKKNLPSAMIYIVVFVIISIAMTKSADADKTFKDTKMKITVFDEDNTPESEALKDFIGSKHKLVELENDRDKIMQQLYFDTVNYVLIINDGFSEKLASGETEGLFSTYHMHTSYSVILMEQTLDSYVSSVRAYITSGHDASEASQLAADVLSQKVDVKMAKYSENADFSSSTTNYFLYLVYIVISVIITALCPVILTMNKKELRYRTNCSCIKTSSYSMQVIAGSLLFVFGGWLIFMAVGIILNGGMFTGRAWYAVLNSFIFTAVIGAVALLVCEFSPSDMVVKLLNQVIGLGMCFTSGVFIPQSLLSDKVITAARFLPAFWYVKVNNMLSGADAYDGKDVAQCMLIEAGFAVTFLLAALVVHRVKYSSASVRLTVPKVKTEH